MRGSDPSIECTTCDETTDVVAHGACTGGGAAAPARGPGSWTVDARVAAIRHTRTAAGPDSAAVASRRARHTPCHTHIWYMYYMFLHVPLRGKPQAACAMRVRPAFFYVLHDMGLYGCMGCQGASRGRHPVYSAWRD